MGAANESRHPTRTRLSVPSMAGCRLTATGSHTTPMRPGGLRLTSGPFPGQEASGLYPSTAARARMEPGREGALLHRSRRKFDGGGREDRTGRGVSGRRAESPVQSSNRSKAKHLVRRDERWTLPDSGSGRAIANVYHGPGQLALASEEMTPGTKLGSYEVLAPLGSGGMGESISCTGH